MPYPSTGRRSAGMSTRGRSGGFNAGTRRPMSGRSSGGYSGRSSAKRGPVKQYIDPAKFVQAAKPAVTEEPYVPLHSFADFAVDDLIKQNIIAKGYVTPSPIQDQTIPQGLAGKDVVGIANTGTGKTAAFALPTLNRLMSERTSKALIMAPTRELAVQIYDECRSIARGSGLSAATLIGGSPMNPQLRDLKGNPSIVIGTPGRIKDHIQQGTLDLSGFSIITLDEVDRMLDMGFIADIRFILSHLAEPRQSFFFSATMEPSIEELIRTFLHDPVFVSVKTGDTSENVQQDVVRYGSPHEKIEKLHDLLNSGDIKKALIFDETKRSVERLTKELLERGFRANEIHGGKTQGQRTRALKQFKDNQINILVATDVAARGIDVADITHVINYSTPQTYSDYVHRIGRAGRAGRTGNALTFIER
jgi:ATP-dependent RNA helicase RhlE